jgi:hypothetical protein
VATHGVLRTRERWAFGAQLLAVSAGMFGKGNGMGGARILLSAPLNRKWWDDAVYTVRDNLDVCSDYERTFFAGVTEAQDRGGDDWNPTVKQFNFMRELAREVG